jgi:hypothetical protein
MLGAKRGDSVGRLGPKATSRLCGKGGRYDRLILTYLENAPGVKLAFFAKAVGLPERRLVALRWWQLAQYPKHWKTFVDSISYTSSDV